MQLNGHKYGFPICLAPMAGYTDMSFRLLCREQGADMVTTEMVSAKGLVYGSQATRALLASCEREQPISVQLFGREPDIVAKAARICEETLKEALLAIDINMGCPAPKITGNGEGSALMREPALAGSIVSAASMAVKCPVTVKCRSGWDASQVNAQEFAKRMEDSGAAMLTLHARTRDRFYAGKADWDVIRQVKTVLSVPLIGNGDVTSGAEAKRILEETGCDGVAVGRAALGDPWIFSEIKAALNGKDYIPPTNDERRAMALRHARLAIEQKGGHALVELRKHIAWYIRGERGAAALRLRVNGAESYEKLAEILT